MLRPALSAGHVIWGRSQCQRTSCANLSGNLCSHICPPHPERCWESPAEGLYLGEGQARAICWLVTIHEYSFLQTPRDGHSSGLSLRSNTRNILLSALAAAGRWWRAQTLSDMIIIAHLHSVQHILSIFLYVWAHLILQTTLWGEETEAQRH